MHAIRIYVPCLRLHTFTMYAQWDHSAGHAQARLTPPIVRGPPLEVSTTWWLSPLLPQRIVDWEARGFLRGSSETRWVGQDHEVLEWTHIESIQESGRLARPHIVHSLGLYEDMAMSECDCEAWLKAPGERNRAKHEKLRATCTTLRSTLRLRRTSKIQGATTWEPRMIRNSPQPLQVAIPSRFMQNMENGATKFLGHHSSLDPNSAAIRSKEEMILPTNDKSHTSCCCGLTVIRWAAYT
ncbi:hypothetical protein K458DRAFT_55674 [Lentithecium fluviatile CBS 122367]|uniref:Uncharacterized protein n=1 Tax=Lentithecium fluviatile CBS 122367 TaxID=1168545 RepID=A0A6G1IY30_9PLEO|nr:hypothetical protein K458DRAFT_55674 [Lentithecium fluviatile CBS 122367]